MIILLNLKFHDMLYFVHGCFLPNAVRCGYDIIPLVYLKAGDVVELRIDGHGTQKQKVRN